MRSSDRADPDSQGLDSQGLDSQGLDSQGFDSRVREALRRTMLAALPLRHPNPDLRDFYGLLRDYPTRVGKLLRGRLTLYATAAHGAPWQRGLQAAAALELFQSWVLVHDDIEDDSEERRGAPALHKTVGVPIALNVGDALHVYMWELLLEIDPAIREAILAEFVTTIHRTAEGQHLDLSWVEQGRFDISADDYLTMVSLKTAYYTVVAPLRLGALCAGRRPASDFTEAGLELGAAFQIRDDVLNLSADVAYGKEFAGDLYEGKRTLILAHLFAHATRAERDDVRARLAKPREHRTAEDVAVALDLIGRYGSLDYAQSVAEAKARSGLGRLAAACRELPEQVVVGKLSRLLESLTRRRQ